MVTEQIWQVLVEYPTLVSVSVVILHSCNGKLHHSLDKKQWNSATVLLAPDSTWWIPALCSEGSSNKRTPTRLLSSQFSTTHLSSAFQTALTCAVEERWRSGINDLHCTMFNSAFLAGKNTILVHYPTGKARRPRRTGSNSITSRLCRSARAGNSGGSAAAAHTPLADGIPTAALFTVFLPRLPYPPGCQRVCPSVCPRHLRG